MGLHWLIVFINYGITVKPYIATAKTTEELWLHGRLELEPHTQVIHIAIANLRYPAKKIFAG